MLEAPGACDELLRELQGDPTRGALVTLALALGRLGDFKATDRRVALAQNDEAGLNVRANAIGSLGPTFDPEAPPRRACFRMHANYYASTPSLRCVRGIL